MLLATISVLVIVSCSHTLRVCPKYSQYLYDPHGNCEESKNGIDMPELVTQYGYKLETYELTTRDGYILTMYRLPINNPKGTILLMHPGTGTCAVWLDKGNTSLAYALHNAGYDVWMINFRGCFYSRKHTHLNPNEARFWMFSYHEVAIYDLPTTIDFIREKTKKGKISCIGHSLGSTAAVVYSALMPQHALENVNLMILMGVAVYYKHSQTPLRYLAGLMPLYYKYATAFGSYEFLPRTELMKTLFTPCRVYPSMEYCTEMFQYLLVGINHTNVDPAYVPVMNSQFPGGVGLRVMVHFFQNLHSGRFAQYDYGEDNIKHYNSDLPPNYPIQNIKTRLILMAGTQEYIGGVKDVQDFHDDLPSEASVDPVVVLEGYNHGDPVYSSTLQKYINEPILSKLNQIYVV